VVTPSSHHHCSTSCPSSSSAITGRGRQQRWSSLVSIVIIRHHRSWTATPTLGSDNNTWSSTTLVSDDNTWSTPSVIDTAGHRHRWSSTPLVIDNTWSSTPLVSDARSSTPSVSDSVVPWRSVDSQHHWSAAARDVRSVDWSWTFTELVVRVEWHCSCQPRTPSSTYDVLAVGSRFSIFGINRPRCNST